MVPAIIKKKGKANSLPFLMNLAPLRSVPQYCGRKLECWNIWNDGFKRRKTIKI
jgi:hypothetical protein